MYCFNISPDTISLLVVIMCFIRVGTIRKTAFVIATIVIIIGKSERVSTYIGIRCRTDRFRRSLIL